VDGRLVESDWDTAMGLVVERTQALLAERGPGSLGFYTTGQFFLEEYYTLATLVRGGLSTPHLDGNTRMCTATAGEALKQTFGSDGQPGSYTDVDSADTIALYGHNVAETQTVLWMRMLDRLRGPNPPRLLVVDPRLTPVAREAPVLQHRRLSASRLACAVGKAQRLLRPRRPAGMHTRSGWPRSRCHHPSSGCPAAVPGPATAGPAPPHPSCCSSNHQNLWMGLGEVT